MKQLIAFDLDDTLAVTKSAVSDRMAELLAELLHKYQVCVISGGKKELLMKQVVDNLQTEHHHLLNLHLLPTCGTRYYRYDDAKREWIKIYAEDLKKTDKQKIAEILDKASEKLGYKQEKPFGAIIEDRGSQVTYSACGQEAPPAVKYKWDPDQEKRKKIVEAVKSELSEFEVRIGGTTSIDVTILGIDKAYGMEKIMQNLEIGKDDILFVGDKLQEGGNDYPVKAMGIDCVEVENHLSTELVIETILKSA